MRARWMAAAVVGGLVVSWCAGVSAQVRVEGYFKKDGTYVQPHYRSQPDGNPYNNWSFPGNVNPYTGQQAPGNPDTYLWRYPPYGGGNSQSGQDLFGNDLLKDNSLSTWPRRR
jgi:hypothetical protein